MFVEPGATEMTRAHVEASGEGQTALYDRAGDYTLAFAIALAVSGLSAPDQTVATDAVRTVVPGAKVVLLEQEPALAGFATCSPIAPSTLR